MFFKYNAQIKTASNNPALKYVSVFTSQAYFDFYFGSTNL